MKRAPQGYNAAMSPMLKSLGIDRLNREDRILLVEELWDSIAAENGTFTLSPEQDAELDRRLAEDDSDPGVSWDEVVRAARAKAKR